MKTVHLWVLLVGLVFSACSKPSVVVVDEERKAPLSVGLFSPIQLENDSTEIFLEDYFPNSEWPDSIRMDAHLAFKTDSAHRKIVVGTMDDGTPWLSTLDLWFGKHSFNLLVRRARIAVETLTFDPEGRTYQKVQVAGEINGWNPDNNPMKLENGKWTTSFLLNPGRYQYQIVVDGKWMLDPANPVKVSNGIGGFNSEMVVGEDLGRVVEKVNLRWQSGENGDLQISSSNTTGNYLAVDHIFAFWENRRIPLGKQSSNGVVSLQIPEDAKHAARSHIRIFAYTDQFWTNDLLIPLSHGKPVLKASELTGNDPQTNNIYFMMVDRFANGDSANDAPINDPRVDPKADFHGGDLAGITKKIKEGYFDSLGINMLWLSPVVQNPEGAYQEYPEPKRWFSGYHGYWPISSTHVDHRFGRDQELIDLVTIAHEHKIKVILDYVANHLHQEHPMIQAHPEWKTELYLKDSVLNVRLWDTHRIGTWFDLFMPSLDYSKPEVVEFQTDSALYWVEHFGLDGFRQDATKHIPTQFWRRLTQKLKSQYSIPTGKPLYQIGETFGNRDLIASYVGSGMLDGQFDFNYYWTLKNVFSGSEKNLSLLAESMHLSETAYGSHSLMGNITGNHDMPRFIAYAGEAISNNEDPKEAGWNRDVQIKNKDGYKRLQLLQAWLLIGSGIPVTYFGDEIGMVGAGDPDNRRDMIFTGLSPEELMTKNIVSRLGMIRKKSMAVLYGTTEVFVQGNMMAMKRAYGGEALWLVVNLGAGEGTFEQFGFDGKPQFQSGKMLEGGGIVLPGLGFEVLTMGL